MANVHFSKYETYKADFANKGNIVFSTTIEGAKNITDIFCQAPRTLDFDQVFVKQVNRCEEDCYNIFKEKEENGKTITRYNLAS